MHSRLAWSVSCLKHNVNNHALDHLLGVYFPFSGTPIGSRGQGERHMSKTISAHQRLRAEHLVSRLTAAHEACVNSAGDVSLFYLGRPIFTLFKFEV